MASDTYTVTVFDESTRKERMSILCENEEQMKDIHKSLEDGWNGDGKGRYEITSKITKASDDAVFTCFRTPSGGVEVTGTNLGSHHVKALDPMGDKWANTAKLGDHRNIAIPGYPEYTYLIIRTK